MNKIKVVGMFMIFYSTVLHLHNYNGLRVVFIKRNVNFNFQISRILLEIHLVLS